MESSLREVEPRLVWLLRGGPGSVPLPAWPGLLLAWRKTPSDPPRPARWQALVAFSRAGSVVELRWCYDTELRPVQESPPMA